MIFVTVGTQQPFDRLVSGVDAWAAERGRNDIFAQIGVSNYLPKNIRFVRFMSPAEYRQAISTASCIAAHAGMGSIISALEYGKPIIVMPKRADLRETRGDHQLATAKRFCGMRGIPVVYDKDELFDALDRLDQLSASAKIVSTASPELMAAIRNFIASV